jgi:ATP-dependent Lhr-like helicase
MASDASDTRVCPTIPASPGAALSCLSPNVCAWFTRRFNAPTAGQCHAWPAIAAKENLLLCAPTGSGKTLAAFLPILSHCLERHAEAVRCVYVAPLKALLADVLVNLRRSIAEIAAGGSDSIAFARVNLRTGDTSSQARRQMLHRPPDILLTTPESLAVLLTQAPWLSHLSAVEWVVVDEVHALAAGRRGADLCLSLERLQDNASRPIQRIGLSATCAPLDNAARFLVGSERGCSVAQVADTAEVQLEVEPLPGLGRGFFPRLIDRLIIELETNTTTLVFTNTRSLAERVTWALRRRFPEIAREIAAHHSSLAPARRRRIERRLKRGRLRLVASSTSLELGVDIGGVDRVVLVHPPGGVARLVQRLGRAGHRPGQTRRGIVLASGPAELLEAAVTCASGHDALLEALEIACHPLDVLCQHLLDDAFTLVRRAAPYRDLDRKDFDDCLAYLSGHREDGSAWIPPRLRWEAGAFTIVDTRTVRILQRNLGTILSEETNAVHGADGGLIGDLDEAFADGLKPGDRFLLDGRCLEFQRRDGTQVQVEETAGQPMTPRWSSDAWPLARDLARRLHVMRTRASEALREGFADLVELLEIDYGLSREVSLELANYFEQQEQVSEIPGPGTLLVETNWGGEVGEYYLHNHLHRAANDGLARVVTLRLARDHGRACTSIVADLGLMISAGGRPLSPENWRGLFAANGFSEDLRHALADSDVMREQFRRCALTGLMLLKNPLGARRKVGGGSWPERRLFEEVIAAEPDFVLLRQATRDTEEECCDLVAAVEYAESLPNLEVRIRRLQQPSPFARHWSQAIGGPTEQTESPEDALRRLHALLTTAASANK